MRKRYIFSLIFSFLFFASAFGQPMGQQGWGGRCPMCGQVWGPQGGYYNIVPETLPEPENKEWVEKLREVLSLERLSFAQYKADLEKFNLFRPYMMVIPQEENHIYWIEAMFKAYGLSPEAEEKAVTQTENAEAAYKLAMDLEADLVPRYQWLIKNAADTDSARVLDTILLQTEMHYTMFEHSRWMGQGKGIYR